MVARRLLHTVKPTILFNPLFAKAFQPFICQEARKFTKGHDAAENLLLII